MECPKGDMRSSLRLIDEAAKSVYPIKTLISTSINAPLGPKAYQFFFKG
jgi:hypothetical protein